MSQSENDKPQSGSYRLKFGRDEFLRLLDEAKPKRFYRVRNFHYFSFDGFVMYCQDDIDDAIIGRKVFNG